MTRVRDLSSYRPGLSLFATDDIALTFLWIVLGLDALEKKAGVPENRNLNEKITDGARGLFEKATGFVSLTPFPHLPPLDVPLCPPSSIAHTFYVLAMICVLTTKLSLAYLARTYPTSSRTERSPVCLVDVFLHVDCHGVYITKNIV